MAAKFNNNSFWIGPSWVYPQTLSAWFNVDNLSSLQMIAAAVRSNGSSTIGMRVEVNGAISAVLRDNAGAETSFSSTSTVTAGTWNHAAVVFTSSSLRKVYLNGTLALTDTTSNAYSLLPNRSNIGLGAVGADQFFGSIAEVGQWDTSLNDAEIASLGKGVKPHRIRYNNLNFYIPLIRAFQDVVGSNGLSVNGTTPSVSNHPRVY